MKLLHVKTKIVLSMVIALFGVQSASAAIAIDRTRVILDGADKSTSINVTNQNKELPYLAQAWLEDAEGNKIENPLVAIPPVQRIEPGSKSQIKIQSMSNINLLNQDRESLYYFNLREIPPKSEKPNTLQIALQTRIKLFYRPAALQVDPNATPWQESLTLTRKGNEYIAVNPTAYYVTISAVSPSLKDTPIKGFKPVMIAPKSEQSLGNVAGQLGNAPVLTYLNDYGGRPRLIFSCAVNACHVSSSKVG